MTLPDKPLVERVARAICLAVDYGMDIPYAVDYRWLDYVKHAEAAITAMQPNEHRDNPGHHTRLNQQASSVDAQSEGFSNKHSEGQPSNFGNEAAGTPSATPVSWTKT